MSMTKPGQGGPRRTALLALGALGVVFGDIGTSPLYTLAECFHSVHGLTVSRGNVLGVVSLVFWSLMLVVSLKYLVFIMRADNQGEGGIFAMLGLLRARARALGRRENFALGLMVAAAAALLYADGAITPALSVISAIEGLEVAMPEAGQAVVPLTCLILVAFFVMQRFGTARIGAIFGPVMLLWFVVLAGLGLRGIIQAPEVLAAVNPLYGIAVIDELGWRTFLLLGSVLLAVTGGEALYADMGHFGRGPIRLAWYGVALGGLVLNYFGQGALLLDGPLPGISPFYALVPPGFVLPMVVLATLATIIASQALVSGAFSLTRQAIQLGYLPPLRIVQTSDKAQGQVYLPTVNWLLMIACVMMVIGFGSSSRLAAAYGFAVAATMVITTVAFFFVLTRVWNWHPAGALALVGFLGVFDGAFFLSTLPKIHVGGWVPLCIAIGLGWLMAAWRAGSRELNDRAERLDMPIGLFADSVGERADLHRIDKPALYVSHLPLPEMVPPALLKQMQLTDSLYMPTIILSLVTDDRPRVPEAERLTLLPKGRGIHQLIARHGFMETPDLKALVEAAGPYALWRDAGDLVYIFGREGLRAAPERGWRWYRRPFRWLHSRGRPVAEYVGAPASRSIELGIQIDF